MRNSPDRLENIKAKHPQLHAQSDTGWLIAEVERLRSDREAINDDLVRGARAEIEVNVLRRELARLEEYNVGVEGHTGDAERLIDEVKRLRAARIADLESVVAFGKHLGASEHVQCSKHTVGDDVVWKAHKLAAALRFNETGEKCSGCGGFRWVHE